MWHWNGDDGWCVQFRWQPQTTSTCIYAFHAYRNVQVVTFIFPLLMGPDWVPEEIKMPYRPELAAVPCREIPPNKEDSSPQQLLFLSFHHRVLSVPAPCGYWVVSQGRSLPVVRDLPKYVFKLTCFIIRWWQQFLDKNLSWFHVNKILIQESWL